MKTKKDNQFTNLQEQIKKHYSEVYDGSMDFMNSLNQFKKTSYENQRRNTIERFDT